jgi:dTDP-4-dehydrorhamnose reductase
MVLETQMKYFLTGGSGVLGTELQNIAQSYGLEYLAPSSKHANILNPETPELLIKEHWKLTGIIHCAAYTDVPNSETKEGRKKAECLNTHGSKNVKSWANVYDLPVIYISTDYVYDGISGGYNETDETNPINYYAYTKLMGEKYMSLEKDLIIRTSFKPNTPWPHTRAFDDIHSSADYVDIIARKISFLLHCFPDPDINGIINVGSGRKSIYELARRRNIQVKPMSKKEITNVKLPDDISMDLSKYNEIYKLITGD